MQPNFSSPQKRIQLHTLSPREPTGAWRDKPTRRSIITIRVRSWPPRIEKSVFISYRRTNLPWALFVYQNLTITATMFSLTTKASIVGIFESLILDRSQPEPIFIVILTPSTLDNCNEPDDWLRREIETAIRWKSKYYPPHGWKFYFGGSLVKKALTGKSLRLARLMDCPYLMHVPLGHGAFAGKIFE